MMTASRSAQAEQSTICDVRSPDDECGAQHLGRAYVPAPPPSVLVVEDDVLVRTVVAAYLRECGFDVVEAGSADEAIRVLEADIRSTSCSPTSTCRAAWTASVWRSGCAASVRASRSS